MPIEITMPKLTDTMTEATLAKWLKKEGDAVKPGDMIAEVETDKATQELEAFEAGTVAKIMIPEGGKTPVGALIVVLAKPGEDVKSIAASAKPSVPTNGAKAAAAPAPAPAPAATPVPTPVAAPAPIAAPAPVAAPSFVNEGKVRVSPLARKIADEKGVDVRTVRGTGPDGRVVKRDILEASGRGPSAGGGRAGVPAAPTIVAKLEAKTVPLSNMRQTIARRLLQSKQTIPHFYVSVDVVMDKLLDLRAQVNEQIAPEKLSVTDFVARGVALALARVPQMNASFGETTIVMHGSVELGIAVALEDGLVVPVVKAAHMKGVRQISAEIKQLAELARSKKLKAEQMTGSTFTISNLGMYGVKDFSAIVNPPESAILAVGGTSWQPVVKEEGGKREIVPAQVMNLTLSADHRVVDGATGAKFLAELKALLESPVAMLL